MNQQTPFNKEEKHKDPIYLELNKLYNDFGQIARDIVFIPQVHFFNDITSHLTTLQGRILWERDLWSFNEEFRVCVYFHRFICFVEAPTNLVIR